MGAIADKIKGTAKKLEGRLTGDKLRIAQGTAQQAKGTIEGKLSSVAGTVKSGARKLKSKLARGIDRAAPRRSRTR
jgi:uncharacterized protein YjbJ (UPF0337 family)